MKKLTNFFKGNLTHKILPFFALFLLIFNLFFVGNVKASFTIELPSGSIEVPDLASSSGYASPSCYLYKVVNGNWQVLNFTYRPDSFYKIISRNNGVIQLQMFDKDGVVHSTVTCGGRIGASSWSETYNDSLINFTEEQFNSPNFKVFGTIYNEDGTIYYTSNSGPEIDYPYIHQNVGAIEYFNSGGIDIYPGSYNSDNTLLFSVQHIVNGAYTTQFSCSLNSESPYYVPMYDLQTGDFVKYRYSIFYSNMGNFVVGDTYRFVLSYAKDNGSAGIDVRDVVIKGASSEIGKETDEIKQELNKGFDDLKVEFQQSTDKIVQEQQKTQEALKENTETNKNIFQKIGDIFNILNPFSENFFAYKLIELLLNALKSLFIPSDNFFNNWLADLNEYFGDRFGILYYPFEVVVDFLIRFVNACDTMSSSSAVINVPEMKFMGVSLISAFSYDFNSLLANDTLKTIHDIYLVVIDVIFSLMLVNLAKNTFAEIFGGRFSDEIVGDMVSISRKGDGNQ